MKIIKSFSYRFAEEILDSAFNQLKNEIISAISDSDWIFIDPPKTRIRKDKIVAQLDINQRETNKSIELQFQKLGWTCQPKIISNSSSNLVADFKKDKIQVEVQFGNMARWYTDIFKFLLSYSADDIEIGVLIVPVLDTAKRIDENIVNFERIIRELPHANMGITLPIWIIGVGV